MAPAESESWAEIRYTEYVKGGHDAWTRALADQRLYPWWARGLMTES